MIISLYAGSMTVRDIQHHLAKTIGTVCFYGVVPVADQATVRVTGQTSKPDSGGGVCDSDYHDGFSLWLGRAAPGYLAAGL